MVNDRKEGKKTFYELNQVVVQRFELIRVALAEESEEEFWESDRSALNRIVDRRRRASERYFDEVADRLGKNYVPGRSWDAIGHFLLRFLVQKSQSGKDGIIEDVKITQSFQKTFLVF